MHSDMANVSPHFTQGRDVSYRQSITLAQEWRRCLTLDSDFLVSDDHPMHRISQQTLLTQLKEIGVTKGDTLLVHTAFSKVKPLENGPAGLIDALLDALGREGTLVMPSMSWEDDVPFDPTQTTCREEMGVVADTFWRMPDVLRSDNPSGFAAMGPLAAEITAPHPIEPPHGINSPAGRVYRLNGKILLLGIGHTANTTIHLAENMAGVRYLVDKYVTVLENGAHKRVTYREIDHCCENFAVLDQWLDFERGQNRGTIGYAEARLMRSKDVVRMVMEKLRENETIFLHRFGVDEECDAARRSLRDASID